MHEHDRGSELSLNGEWTVAAPDALCAAVERNEAPATPLPGSPPPDLLDGPGPEGFRVIRATVPGCWEAGVLPKPYEGPVWYVRPFEADADLREAGSARLEFDAVSYFCTVWLNGRKLGEHRGMWDPFSFEVGGLLEGRNTLAVEVYKPWRLFPVRRSLAGFIPYVTTTFGGPWQSVRLRATGDIELRDLFVEPTLDAAGRRSFRVSGVVDVTRREAAHTGPSGTPTVRVSAHLQPHGAQSSHEPATRGNGPAGRTVDIEPPGGFSIDLSSEREPDAWSPATPNLIRVEVVATMGTSRTTRTIVTGHRTVGAHGRKITLHDQPIYPRGVLHWLSYPDQVCPAPDRATIRREIEQMLALGYSMIKLCLVVPPESYFEIADELGMMLWLELPMWLPSVDEEYRQRAKTEYRRILRRLRNHPSIVLYTLGCELSSEADAEFLRELYDIVKDETHAALVRDNSGSAECYGGVDLEFADYHDYHFYAEAPVFTDLLDYFIPAYKSVKPLIFGEYCDSDTFRSVAEVKRRLGRDLYWSHDDPVSNPQGVRWDYNVVTNEERLASIDLDIDFEEIKRRSYARSLAYRKSIVEQTRIHETTSGYVITNIQDTPITTSGMLDDFGRLKFDPEAFRHFNAETVLALAPDKRRIWRRGGDRPQHLDSRVFAAGSELRLNLLVAHGGSPLDGGRIDWALHDWARDVGVRVDGATAGGTIACGRMAGDAPVLAGVVDCGLPAVESPRRVRLSVELRAGRPETDRPVAANAFELWVLPDVGVPWDAVDVVDDRGLFADDLRRAGLAPVSFRDLDRRGDRPVVATRWHDSLTTCGRPIVLLLDDSTSELTEEVPFFREAIALVHEHPVVSQLPHDGIAGTMWTAVTPDRALAYQAVANRFDAAARPIVSRLDARTSLLTHYATELVPSAGGAANQGGAGAPGQPRVIVTAFALAGSFGRTPQGLRANHLGRYLLTKMIEYVAG